MHIVDSLASNFIHLLSHLIQLVEVLNDLRTKLQPAGRLTNGETKGFVKQLKYNISNLGEQWPESVPLESPSTDHKYLRHLQSITPESSDCRLLLQDEDRRPQVVEAFIWKILATEVFGHFHWAGGTAAPHTWKTTQLFFEALNSRGDDEKDQNKLYLERMKNNVTLLIIETLGLSINSSGSIAEQLDDILQGAIQLDKKFCQQAARWEWKYSYKSHHEGALVFDGDFMNLDRAERLSSDEKAQAQRLVRFVISPALIKLGGKDGMNDELETTVMKMVVSRKN
ncbi:uncharacterized protein FPRN_11561 [Fusarium proliferatum]|nr:uncharacterized protein FPRN_11561 [Fusarium proliferatum]